MLSTDKEYARIRCISSVFAELMYMLLRKISTQYLLDIYYTQKDRFKAVSV